LSIDDCYKPKAEMRPLPRINRPREISNWHYALSRTRLTKFITSTSAPPYEIPSPQHLRRRIEISPGYRKQIQLLASLILRRPYSSVSQIIHTMASEEPARRKCSGADCDNDAGTLQCPTCLKLGTKDSYFCSQDCFKRNWVRSYFVSAAGWPGMALKN
jgi:hypothetical protein